MLPPLQVDNIFVFIRQMAPVPACWLFKTSATRWPLTFWPWKFCLSESRVMWATCLPILVRTLCSRVTPDVRDKRQTDVRHTVVRENHRLMPPPYGTGGIKSSHRTTYLRRAVDMLDVHRWKAGKVAVQPFDWWAARPGIRWYVYTQQQWLSITLIIESHLWLTGTHYRLVTRV